MNGKLMIRERSRLKRPATFVRAKKIGRADCNKPARPVCKTTFQPSAIQPPVSFGGRAFQAKAWKRDEPEPDAWAIEVKHKTAHPNGCPGLFSFVPQDQRTYHDNIVVTAN